MSISREYYPIADAAGIIGCTEEDLIHLGANEKLQISAMFAYDIAAERDDFVDMEFGGPKKCFGVGPFLLDSRELRALEAGNCHSWCRTIWTQDGESRYAFKLQARHYSGEIDTPSKLIVMAMDVKRLLHARNEPDCGTASHANNPTAYDTNGVTVSLPHMTKSLEAVFKVMWENWKDPHPKRLPKQINIAREIDAALGYKSEKDDMPSRNAKVIAAIIKPDMINGTD